MISAHRLRATFAAAVVVAVLGAVAPAASASSYYWYQTTPTGGWWVGGGNDAVGSGFLESQAPDGQWRVVTGGGTGSQPWAYSSGDYCNFYGLNDLNNSDPRSIGSYTGYTPPSPVQNYQIYDGVSSDSSCQANGNVWGEYVSAEAGSNCPNTCGLQHSVSLGDSGTTLMPWASSFGDPELVIKTNYHLGGYTYSCNSGYGCGAGWAYVCVLLQDTTTSQRLEDCLNKWSTYGPGDDPTPTTYPNVAGEHGNGAGQYNGFANVQTNFDSYSDRATLSQGSATSQLGAGFDGQTASFEASISPMNLQTAINAVNSHIESEDLAGQVQLPYSTDSTKYAIIGIEDGQEFWGGQTSLGGYDSDLEVFTQY